MEILLIGPVGHVGRGSAKVREAHDHVMDYMGFRLIARARRGPVGWVGELTILLPGAQSPLQGVSLVPRFHQDFPTAIQEAFLEGIRRVDRGQVIQL
jgi:hypothetical protein